MAGKLYGIGVGPGDPELLTIKAVRLLKTCDIIALPGRTKEECTAFQIAVQAVPELTDKKLMYLYFPMVKQEAVLMESHERAAAQVMEALRQDQDVALITLGDASIYSTYLYIHERVGAMGFETEIVSGIPSFCAVAARLNMALVNGSQELHIIPASYQVEQALTLPGVKVLMKAGRQMKAVKELLIAGNRQVVMVENCGMEQERIYGSAREIPEDAGYFSLLIVR